MFPLYRNQSVGLHSKSTDWFLHNGNIGRLRVKFRDFAIFDHFYEILYPQKVSKPQNRDIKY